MRILTACAMALLVAGCGGDATNGSDGAMNGGGDGGATADLAGSTSDGGGPGGEWLTVSGNHILGPDGKPWHGRGANVHDTRSCNACTYLDPQQAGLVADVNQHVDALCDDWHANFLRLDLESYATDDGYRVQYKGVLDDPSYLADLVTIVDHVATKPSTYVLLSVWIDPTVPDPPEWPTDGTRMVWQKLADTFRDQPRVLYGLVNEPHADPSLNDQLWTQMNETVQVIRDVEDMRGTPHHVVVVQGTNDWARTLAYWVDHPITAGGGGQIAYETHPYNPTSDFDTLFIQPSKTIPVIIGEFGPFQNVTDTDLTNLMDTAEQLEIPYLAWNFHHNCSPDLLVDNTSDGCHLASYVPTAWGQMIKDRFAKPW